MPESSSEALLKCPHCTFTYSRDKPKSLAGHLGHHTNRKCKKAARHKAGWRVSHPVQDLARPLPDDEVGPQPLDEEVGPQPLDHEVDPQPLDNDPVPITYGNDAPFEPMEDGEDDQDWAEDIGGYWGGIEDIDSDSSDDNSVAKVQFQNLPEPWNPWN